MRVTGPTAPPVGANSVSASKQTNASELFELALGESGGGAAVVGAGLTGTAALSGLDTILALQEVARDIGSRKRAIRRSHEVLDKLDEVKVGLLNGTIDAAALDRIVDLLSQREASGDPRIDEVMDEIDLRARVELAKLGKYSD